MNIFKYFRQNGYDMVEPSFYAKIEEWERWYNADVPKFHSYRVYKGSGCSQRCRRLSLKMAKRLSEDIADLLLNERVKITIADEPTSAYVTQVLEDNNFLVLGNEYQERKACTGTVAYVPYLRDAELDGMGRTVSGRIGINYVTAKNIFPLSWDNGRIIEAAFLYPKIYQTTKYAQLEFHKLDGNGEYVIENHVLKVSKAENGEELTPEEWQQIPLFAGLAAEVQTHSRERQFVIDRLNLVNNASYDETNPMGIAVFANSLDTLRKIDLEYDSYSNEFQLGKKRLFVAPEMLSDENGNPVFDPDDAVFYQLPEDTLKDAKSPIQESNMQLRIEEHSKAINDDLNMLSFKCGFGTERYRFDKGSVQTATQVISENSDLYRMIKKHEIILGAAIKELIAIIARMGNSLGESLKEDAEVTIDFDDSIIEDKETERAQDRQDVAMGVMSLAEYRAKWYGETEEEAAQKLPEQKSEVME